MAEQENGEVAHLRPACVACTYQCNKLHADRDLEQEKFDPDRSWPYFRKKVSKLSVHQSPQSAICIPGAFMEDYPNTFQRGKSITLEGPSGNIWKVGAVERSVLYLGWRAFAHDHRLREGDQLNFNLTKPSHFVVDIFNSNGDVRRSAQKATVTGKYAVAAFRTPTLKDQTRKRKEMETGYGSGMPTNADRCKTTAKRGNFNVQYTMGPRLKFSEKTKQWESHEERGGREVVNLDSDDEEPEGQVRNYERSSKIERLIEFMREEEIDILPESAPPVTQVVKAGEEHHQVVEKGHQEISGDGEENYAAYEQQENEPLDEEKQTPSDPLRQFTTIFDTRAMETHFDLRVEKPAMKAKMEKLDSTSDLLSRQAQISCDEDMAMMKEEEEEETHLVRVVHSDDVELDNTLKRTQGAAVGSSVAMSIPNASPQPHKIDDTTISRKETNTAEQDNPKVGQHMSSKEAGVCLKAQPSNPHVIENFDTISPKNILHSAMEEYQKPSSPIQEASENHTNAASNKVLQSYTINPIAQEAAADYESLTNKALGTPANSSPVTLLPSTSAMSEMYESKPGTVNSMAKDVKMTVVNGSQPQGKVQEEEGEFSFETLENIVNIPVIDTINEVQRDSVHPLKQGLISHERADDLDTLNLKEDELHLTETKDSEHEECIRGIQELHVTKIEPEENPNRLPVFENTKENEIVPSTNGTASQTRNEDVLTAMASSILTPVAGETELQLESGNEVEVMKKQTLEEVMVGHPQRKLESKELANISDAELTPDAAQEKEKNFNIQARPTSMIKTDTNTCVLRSKRGRVGQGDREKALKEAQVWAKKLRNPNFIAVMKSSHVYTNFNMDIPAEFGKQSKLPPTEARVTLVSEEVPTNCKAIWEGRDLENPKLNAKGWMNFSRSHFLEEGDACVFESLNRGTAFRIGVYIFRVVALKKPIILDWTRHYMKVPETNPTEAQTHIANQAPETNVGEMVP